MTLADAEARQAVTEHRDESLFVDAGAGSGKTSVLVQRVVASVLEDGIPLSETAVVTFTEKAGNELRDRLRGAFEDRLRTAQDGEPVARAKTALDDLDAAAIGTLHSFAQRILAAFPIQAGMPPLIEVLDEVASSVAFDARWAAMWRRLLDDDALAETLQFALGVGIDSEKLRSLARAFGNDWDLIESHVLAHPAQSPQFPDTQPLLRQAILVSEQASGCRDESDRFLRVIRRVAHWIERFSGDQDDRERYALISELSALKPGVGGRGANWEGNLAELKEQVRDLASAAGTFRRQYADAALRPIARWVAAAVLDAARERVASGSLEFHDLLVASRDLLRHDGDARAELQHTYRRLLLDEFQDTDPIQIELALRIVGGRAADAEDLRDIDVPAGSVFVVGDPKQSIYRFRRANIATYLTASEHLGRRVTLSTNFRSVPAVLEWVNQVFGSMIQAKPLAQPAYEPLGAHRTVLDLDGTSFTGPAVTLLGAEAHAGRPSAADLRIAEARNVASVIAKALTEGWTVQDAKTGVWRPLTLRDIAILLPARTSLPFLETALDEMGIAYRTESSSLVYQSDEIRSLMAAARAIADPSDQLSAVSALRSPLFGCGDDDLFAYRRDGGSFTVSAPVNDELAGHPVGVAMSYLNDLYYRSRWLTPAEVLTDLVVERRVLETSSATEPSSRARDQFGRVRFVIDQARAWSEVEHGGLRAYLAWAAHQAQDAARVAESLLPETDLDVVRIMTVHAAKGLEFGMVVLSGMTSQSRRPSGVQLLWQDHSYAVKLSATVETNDFAEAAPLDEQMDSEERRRLLYVAATRARDHLLVSLHRSESGPETAARLFEQCGALGVDGVMRFDSGGADPLAAGIHPEPAPSVQWDEWWAATETARRRSRTASVRTASGLEGTEPDVVWAIGDADGSGDQQAAELAAGSAKGPRDVELAPWLKGRYGNLIGRAVHGTLQAIDGDTSLVDQVAGAQSLAEGVPSLSSAVASFVRSALATDVVARAFVSEHWTEVYVGMVEHDGIVLEGFIDLLFRDADGSLVIVDYKTDTVTDATDSLAQRAAHYAPQLHAYIRALEAATGELARAQLVFLDGSGSAGLVIPVEALTTTGR
ncbi:UvrD-helicase domain-containing protein [Agromyces sp. SYSU T00194]|uniref:UvrD-helicase domain-containing protein n=1 Tax=Agromyces chitinivorans TaxID=3158560 RepID=UPI003397BA97